MHFITQTIFDIFCMLIASAKIALKSLNGICCNYYFILVC